MSTYAKVLLTYLMLAQSDHKWAEQHRRSARVCAIYIIAGLY